MNKNTKVETTKKGQATNNNIAENRRKAREEQFRNFRIGALRRRCERTGISKEQTEEYVKKLIEQLNAPKEYTILIQMNQKHPRKKLPEGEIFKKDIDIFIENLDNAKIKYNFKGSDYVYLNGDQNILAKVREIAPDGAKISPYAKKMESVMPPIKERSGYIAKNNDKSTTAKGRRLQRKADKLRKKQLDGMAVNNHKLHAELQKEKRMNSRRKVAKKIKMLHKRFQKAALKANKKKGGTTVQLNSKKGSEGLKKAA